MGMEANTGAPIGAPIVVVNAMAPEFETEEEVCDVVERDPGREMRPLDTTASGKDDTEAWTISDKYEILGLSVTVHVCMCIDDAEDTSVGTEASGTEVERSGVS